MWQDPIVTETRALRDEYARQFNYDIDAIFQDLMAKQARHPERIVSFPPRKPMASIHRNYMKHRDTAASIDRRLCVAPMLHWTDRHERFFLRLITRRALLYTEMITTGALLYGHGNGNDRADNHERFLGYDASEHPVALQLGGSDPQSLAECARLAEDYGYDEVNLNCGCPSGRVRSGRFGASLFAEPALVARCVGAMRRAVAIPVTVKTRIGIHEPGRDEQDTYRDLAGFVETVAGAGCETFIIHARKAWLGCVGAGGKRGLSPAENRQIPPLRYDVAGEVKREFPALTIILNGGVTDIEGARGHLDRFDGVMMGRAAYHHPYGLAGADALIFGDPHPVPSRREVMESFIPYVEKQLAKGVPLGRMTRHILGVFGGQPGAGLWRRTISEHAHLPGAGVEVIRAALDAVSV